ncbi:hypothetical protein LX36DRAFT_604149 [Colletotrichum falcatum]|nr:hypothetical protein LX36DRAFT_604149 [Colletotrichum falcatum]
MKFFAPIVLLAAGVLADPSPSDLCEREVSDVNSIMSTVLDGIQTLDNAICAYDGGSGADLENASTIMLTVIRTATNNAAAMLPLTMDEAIAFQPLSDKLNAAGDKLLTDLDDKVPLIAKSGACDSTLTWVDQVGNNVNTLMTTISTKFPAGGKGGDEITHFNGIFAQMREKLSGCSTGATGSGTDDKGVGSATKVAVPTYAAGNGTNGASPTGTLRPVVTAGAALMTFSGAGLAAAIAAFIL